MLKPFYQNKLEELVIDVKAFEECLIPKIGTSGMPLFYYIKTENLLCDGGKWEEYGGSSSLMIKHAFDCYKKPIFKELSTILAEFTKKYLSTKKHQIAGFQRRDWPFSGICALLNNKDHFSFYKNNKIEVLDSKASLKNNSFKGSNKKQKIVFVGDLLNVGHTALKGWIPMLKMHNYQCRDAVYIFSRNQGGEKNLKQKGIKPHSLIKIGVKFLERHCKNKNFCISYWKNPIATSAMYLRKKGAYEFLPYFNPNLPASKHKRVVRFYNEWLVRSLSNAQTKALNQMTKSEFGWQIDEILEKFNKKNS